MSTSAIAMHLPAPPQTSRRSQVRAIDRTPPHPETRMAAETADEGNPTPDTPSGDADGLQQIKGIGQSIAQALHSLGYRLRPDRKGHIGPVQAQVFESGIVHRW